MAREQPKADWSHRNADVRQDPAQVGQWLWMGRVGEVEMRVHSLGDVQIRSGDSFNQTFAVSITGCTTSDDKKVKDVIIRHLVAVWTSHNRRLPRAVYVESLMDRRLGY